MGAITTGNRKRSDDSGNAFTNKKPRFFSNSSAPARVSLNYTSTSVADRVRQYPEPVHQLKRPVHAPCSSSRIRNRLGLHNNNNRKEEEKEKEKEERMGNFITNYVKPFLWRRSSNDTSNYNRYTSLSYVDEVVVGNGGVGVVDLSDDDDDDVVEVMVRGNEEMMEVDDGDLKHPSGSSVVSEDLGDGKLKVEKDVGKVLDVVSVVSRECEVGSGVPAYKKLKDGIDKKYEGLRKLLYDIELNWKRLAISRLYRPAKKEKDVVKEPFVPLTNEEAFEVTGALSNAKRRKVLVTHENSNIQITGELLQCLRPGAWLNDEVINVYLELLKEREKRDPQKFLKCHFFNTFFYKKLIGGRSGYDFKSVRRWTTQRKLGYCLLECDKIFVPIHKEVHWCLAVIDRKDKKFQYLDSMRGSDNQVMKVLAQYFVDEVKDKSGEDIDVSTWKQECVQDLPEQENGFDCGMFMIKYCDFYSRDVGLCFNQGNMPYFRQRTAKEILRLKAD